MSSKSSRWLQRDWFTCGLCNNVQKHIRGYKPLPNPVLFDVDDQYRAWSKEKNDSVGYIDQHFMKKCDNCKTLHGSWTWIDFQEAIRRKEKDILSSSSSSSSASVNSSVSQQQQQQTQQLGKSDVKKESAEK